MFLILCQYVKDLLITWVIRFYFNHFATQEMCSEAVRGHPFALRYVPDHFVTQEMCNQAVQSKHEVLEHVPDRFKTQEMCEYP